VIRPRDVRAALKQAGYVVSSDSTFAVIRAYRPHVEPHVTMWYTLVRGSLGSAWRVHGHMTGPEGQVDFFPRPGQSHAIIELDDLTAILASGPVSIPYRRAS
jgi:hypothetical protein